MKPKDSLNLRCNRDTIGFWLNSARAKLKTQPDEPTSSLHALISFVLEKPSYFGISHPEYTLSEQQRSQLDALLIRLVDGVPLPYLIGSQEFFGIEFLITADVLIPRPETEQLVELAIQWFQRHPGPKSALDIGTGSGCIPISICKNVSRINFLALDRSFKALQVAGLNIQKNHLQERINLAQMDLTTAIFKQFDFICANLPYIPEDRLPELAVSRYEPNLALNGGREGMELIKRLIINLDGLVLPGGVILLEIDYSQSGAVSCLVNQYISKSLITIIKDLAGLPRIVKIEKLS